MSAKKLMTLPLRDARGRFLQKSLPPVVLGTVELPVESPPVLFGENYHTAQIYSKGFEFAFASHLKEVWTQACTFVYCKDFLHDAVWAHLNKKPWSIYGFKYTPGTDPDLDMDHCAMFFRNTVFQGKPSEFHDLRIACQEFLNLCEVGMGLEPTQIYQVEHAEGPCWLVVGDKGWQLAPPQLGLYTLLLRVGLAHQLGDSCADTLKRGREGKIKFDDGSTGYAGNRDGNYIKTAWKGVSAILQHGTKIWHPEIQNNYPVGLKEKLSFHDDVGPVSYSQEIPKKFMPFWYRKEVWK